MTRWWETWKQKPGRVLPKMRLEREGGTEHAESLGTQSGALNFMSRQQEDPEGLCAAAAASRGWT